MLVDRSCVLDRLSHGVGFQDSRQEGMPDWKCRLIKALLPREACFCTGTSVSQLPIVAAVGRVG